MIEPKSCPSPLSCGAVRRRVVAAGRDEGSLILVFLVMLIAMALSLLVLSTLVVQAQASRLDAKRVRDLHSAQAGLDVVLGQIRAANDGSGNGVRASLPCGPLTGSVDQGSSASYSATVAYYTSDPSGQSASWLSSNQLTCTSGSGPSSVPGYALVSATGTSPRANPYGSAEGTRTLTTTYVFQTTNANISGGLIHVYNDGASGHVDLCMDAGSSSPAAGTVLQVKTCVAGSAQQTFAYQADLTLALVSTVTTSSAGMCLDASPTAGTVVKFQACTDGTGQTVQTRQQWSFNDVASFEGANSSGTLNGLCFSVMNPNTDGSQVNLATNTCNDTNYGSGGYNIQATWDPATSVGAGAAGSATNQLVNFLEFGRCLDVTNQKTDWAYLIDFPCKQAPIASNITWNQKFTYDSTTKEIYTTASGTNTTGASQSGNYCIKSPLSTSGTAYVVMTRCPSTTASNVQWTLTGKSGVYSTSYTIVDASGNCLSLGSPGSATAPLNQWSTITVGTCDGSLKQKWNAPPNLVPSATVNTYEK